MRISTMAKTRMVLGALKHWRWEEHPGGANFPYEVNFPPRERMSRGSESLWRTLSQSVSVLTPMGLSAETL